MADLGLYLWVPLQLGLVGLLAWRSSTGDLSGWEFVAAALVVGLTTGAGGINVAHELMHRSDRFSKACSEILMTSVTYTHFCVEHIWGHHRRVATPEDPASSRRGEGLILFWPRTLWGGLRSAWGIETERVRSGRGGRGLADRRIRYPLDVLAYYGLAWFVFGELGVAAVAAQSLVAILLLETINYIEHYGLARQRLASGNYERVRPQHSWNASHRVSNWFLFNLQRHSDHHYKASRPYWKLRHYDDVPQLPFSYPTAFLVALLPPLWRSIMDPRVDAWNERNAAEVR
jgi:alkane 1-monooxygenase